MRGASRAGSALFRQHRVVGEALRYASDDERFGLAIHLGDDVARAALVVDGAQRAEAAEKESARAPRGVHGDLEEGIGHDFSKRSTRVD